MKHVDNIATLIKSPVLLIGMFVIGMLLVGCVAEDMSDAGNAGNGGNILLKFRLNSSAPATRSADGGELPGIAGEVDESRIDLNDIWIGVFDTDGGRIGVAASPLNGGSGSSVAVESFEASVKEIEINCEDIYVVALANWSGYGISAEQLNGISKAEDLCKLVFSYPNPIKEGDLLPMYGYSEITVSPEMRYLEIDVELRRSLAKIVINDCMEGDVKIESVQSMPFKQGGNVVPDNCNLRSIVQMVDHTSVENMSVDKVEVIDFIKREDEDSRIFYLYLPEIKLGDEVKGEDRKIILKLSDGTSRDIYIAHHNSGELEKSSSPEWNSLLRNYVYRFNVKGELSSEPEIEIQRKIRVCWYVTNLGRFCRGTYKFGYSIGESNISLPYLNCTFDRVPHPKPSEIAVAVEIAYYDIDLGESDLQIVKSKYEDLFYAFAAEEGMVLSNLDKYKHRLCTDVVKIENKDDITYCWLNSPTVKDLYYDTDDSDYLATDRKYRIYWCGDDKTYKIEVYPLNNVRMGEVIYDNVRNYWYSDFEFLNSPSYKQFQCDITGSNNKSVEFYYYKGFDLYYDFRIKTENLTEETVNGEIYSVFYIN